MDGNNGIPRNADKILYAEDFVHYVMNCMARVEIPPSTVEEYRDLIYNGFNKNTKIAIRFIDSTMSSIQEDILSMLDDEDKINSESYNIYAKSVYKESFRRGFDASNFLYYCTELATLAVCFYTRGVSEAPALAIQNILSAIEEFDMSTGAWETLNRMAERFATWDRDCSNELTPETTDSED